MNFLTGKKTYLIAGAVALATFAHIMGWLDDGVYQMICGLLGAGGLAALRAGVTKSGQTGPGPFPAIDAGGPGLGQ